MKNKKNSDVRHLQKSENLSKKKNEKIKGKYYKIPFQNFNFTTQIKIPFREFLLYHRCAG